MEIFLCLDFGTQEFHRRNREKFLCSKEGLVLSSQMQKLGYLYDTTEILSNYSHSHLSISSKETGVHIKFVELFKLRLMTTVKYVHFFTKFEYK